MVAPEEEAGAAGKALVATGQAKSSVPNINKLKITTVQSHTKAVGLIIPPPDIRLVLEKTAQFVAKNGAIFEKKILANEEGNNKFQFLISSNPYHAYYQKKVEEFKSGEAEAKESAAEPKKEEPPPEAVTVIRTKDLVKPDPEKYTVRVPEGLSAMDIDVIKLTAQFVARNGRSFLQEIANRESRNPLFNFLRPTHSLHGYFTSLADAYARVLIPPKVAISRLEEDMADRTKIMERCLRRLEFDKALDRERQEAIEEAEKERMEMQTIDWHDFVVVETIEFFDNEDLPPPISQQELLQIRKAQELGVERAPAEEEQEAPAAMDMDEEEAAMVAEGEGRAPGAVRVVEEEGPVRVVKDYRREIQRRGVDASKYVVSPLTGELVPISDMEEHMRISLIDPRWREQRETMLAKIRDTTKAEDEEITSNLMTLAKTRPDIFATTEEELQGVLTDAIESKKTTGAGRAVAWDGFSKGKAAADQQREAEEQKREGAVKAFPRVHNPAAPEQGAAERPEEQASKRQKTGGE